MIKIAITGNIASGKSAVQRILEKKNYKVLDTDEVSREILNISNKPLYEAFKNYDVFENGDFSRYKVGQLIFSDEHARKLIANIMHPQIKEIILKFFEDNKSEDIVFVGIPLLFEAKMQNIFDKIIFIYTDDGIRLKRLLNRNNYTLEHAKARMNSQMPQDEKVKLCDYVVYNNGTLNELEEQIEKILNS